MLMCQVMEATLAIENWDVQVTMIKNKTVSFPISELHLMALEP